MIKSSINVMIIAISEAYVTVILVLISQRRSETICTGLIEINTYYVVQIVTERI